MQEIRFFNQIINPIFYSPLYIYCIYFTSKMTELSGRLGKETVKSRFEGSKITFIGLKKIQTIENVWFVYFQRVSKRLKSCDAIFFNGTELVELVVQQGDIEKITDAITYPSYIGGMDPLPWKKMEKTAKKYDWTIEDWQHVLEDPSESQSDSDGDWIPPLEEEDSEEEDSRETRETRKTDSEEEEFCRRR